MESTSLPRRAGAARPSAIPPFWDRMPLFFSRPFHLRHLLWLGGLSLASLLAFVVPLPKGLAVVIAQGFVWMAGARYAFGCMEACSRGLMDQPDALGWRERDADRENLPWKFIGLMVCCIAVVGAIGAFSKPVAQVANWLWCLAIPAITMQLSASNDFSESLEPGRWWHFIRSIGWPYALLCLFLLLLVTGMPKALGLLTPILGGPLALPLVNFVGLYFLLVGFMLMGYVMYQYHEPLGLWALKPEDHELLDPKAQLEQDIGELVADGQPKEALALAERALYEHPGDMQARERVYKLLRLNGDTQRMPEHALALFQHAMGLRREGQALGLYRELHAMGRAPTLSAEQSFALAEAADREHDTPLAVQLVNGFDKRYPQNALLPDVYFFSARVASERMRRHDQARSILRALVQRFPQHALVVQAQQYLQVLDKMGPSSVSGQ